MSANDADKTISTAAEAERAIANLNAIMDSLIETVTEETARVGKGRLREALALDSRKSELAASFVAESTRVKAAHGLIARSLPQALDALRTRHTAFQALLHRNLTVVATAHAVSEGIIRGVSTELARRRSPSTYGATGRVNAPGQRSGQPIAISRTL